MSISESGIALQNRAESSLVVGVKEKQDSDSVLLELHDAVHNQRVDVFSQGEDGVLRYQGRLCVPDMGELRNISLQKPITLDILFIQVPLRCTAVCRKSIGEMA